MESSSSSPTIIRYDVEHITTRTSQCSHDDETAAQNNNEQEQQQQQQGGNTMIPDLESGETISLTTDPLEQEVPLDQQPPTVLSSSPSPSSSTTWSQQPACSSFQEKVPTLLPLVESEKCKQEHQDGRHYYYCHEEESVPLVISSVHQLPLSHCSSTSSNSNNNIPALNPTNVAATSNSTATAFMDGGGEAEFLAAVRFCVYIGKAAFRYGSPGSKVEPFLQRLLEDRFGYHQGMFRATQSELMCSVTHRPDDVPRTFLISLEPGLNLNKLGLLADLVDRVVGTTATTNTTTATSTPTVEQQQQQQQQPPLLRRVEAIARLKEIESAQDPWGPCAVFTSFPIVGAGLAMVLGGSWWDVLVASSLGIICYATIEYLPKLGRRNKGRFAQWVPLVAAFWTSTMATVVKRAWLPELHVTLVTLSAIAVLLPGYTVSMGIGELVANRIISGFANLVGGMVTMLWLVLGAWLGDAFGGSITPNSAYSDVDDDNVTYTSDQVPMAWQALFVPLLCLSLIIAFQVSRRDVIWCFLHLLLTYLIFLVTGLILEHTHDAGSGSTSSSSGGSEAASSILAAGGKNLRTYLSTVVSCVAANAWALATNRPHSILLVPSLVFLVSGSIGFQGLLTILLEEENKSTGTDQFLQMIIVAVLIVAGLLTGNTLLEPSTTL